MSLPEYLAELNRVSATVESPTNNSRAAAAVAKSLPAEWTVQADGQTFRISTTNLKAKLEELQRASQGDTLRALRAQIADLRTDAEAFGRDPEDRSKYHAQLASILSRNEFHDIHGPTWWDRLKQELTRALVHFLERIFGSSAFPTVSRIMVWALVAVAVVALAWWTFKVIRRNARLETILPESPPVSAKQWAVWLSEAQAAGALGRWRDAVHLAYWAGISFLEDKGAWRPDRARTPREYLRLLASSSEYRNALSGLTRQFEVVWYGYRDSGPEAFAETLSYLEKLGCRSN